MQRFCVRCRKEIPAQRVTRGSCFCSPECRREDRIERRRAIASRQCRLCGRPFSRRRPRPGRPQPPPGP